MGPISPKQTSLPKETLLAWIDEGCDAVRAEFYPVDDTQRDRVRTRAIKIIQRKLRRIVTKRLTDAGIIDTAIQRKICNLVGQELRKHEGDVKSIATPEWNAILDQQRAFQARLADDFEFPAPSKEEGEGGGKEEEESQTLREYFKNIDIEEPNDLIEILNNRFSNILDIPYFIQELKKNSDLGYADKISSREVTLIIQSLSILKETILNSIREEVTSNPRATFKNVKQAVIESIQEEIDENDFPLPWVGEELYSLYLEDLETINTFTEFTDLTSPDDFGIEPTHPWIGGLLRPATETPPWTEQETTALIASWAKWKAKGVRPLKRVTREINRSFHGGTNVRSKQDIQEKSNQIDQLELAGEPPLTPDEVEHITTVIQDFKAQNDLPTAEACQKHLSSSPGQDRIKKLVKTFNAAYHDEETVRQTSTLHSAIFRLIPDIYAAMEKEEEKTEESHLPAEVEAEIVKLIAQAEKLLEDSTNPGDTRAYLPKKHIQAKIALLKMRRTLSLARITIFKRELEGLLEHSRVKISKERRSLETRLDVEDLIRISLIATEHLMHECAEPAIVGAGEYIEQLNQQIAEVEGKLTPLEELDPADKHQQLDGQIEILEQRMTATRTRLQAVLEERQAETTLLANDPSLDFADQLNKVRSANERVSAQQQKLNDQETSLTGKKKQRDELLAQWELQEGLEDELKKIQAKKASFLEDMEAVLQKHRTPNPGTEE